MKSNTKKYLKFFLSLILLFSITINQSYAITTLKPKYKLTLPQNAFQKDLAVHNKNVYYVISSEKENSFTVYERAVNSNKTKEVYKCPFDTGYGFNNSGVFKLLGDKNLYFVRHIGGGVMGYDAVIGLSGKNKGSDILGFYGTLSFDENGNTIYESDPYFMGANEGREYYYSFGSNDDIANYSNYTNRIFKFAPSFPNTKNGDLYQLKISYSDGNSNLVRITTSKKDIKEEILSDVSNFTMSENDIYYWKYIPTVTKIENKKYNKQLWKHSLKDDSKSIICQVVDADYYILPIKDNVFFMGNKEYKQAKKEEKKEYNTLFIAKNNKCTPLYSNMKRVVSDGKNIAVLFQKEKSSEVKILNKDGVEFANITVPLNQTDIFISDKDLIVWSWQDKSVRYYEIY